MDRKRCRNVNLAVKNGSPIAVPRQFNGSGYEDGGEAFSAHTRRLRGRTVFLMLEGCLEEANVRLPTPAALPLTEQGDGTFLTYCQNSTALLHTARG